MNIELTGKTALVTGSTDGIGFATAQALAVAGATVIVNGRDPDKVAAAVARAKGGARGVAADMGEADGCAALIAAVRQADFVVSNASVFEPSDFVDTNEAVWGHDIERTQIYALMTAIWNAGRVYSIAGLLTSNCLYLAGVPRGLLIDDD